MRQPVGNARIGCGVRALMQHMFRTHCIATASFLCAQNVKEQCGNLWAMLKTGAQSTWKEWASQRAAELAPSLVVRRRDHFG